jgi:hypothetical protein
VRGYREYLTVTDDAALVSTPYPPSISGIGAGRRWLLGRGVTAGFYYAKALHNVDVGNSLEDRGIYFRVTTALF